MNVTCVEVDEGTLYLSPPWIQGWLPEMPLEAQVAELLEKAESVDNADIPYGMDNPAELSIRRERIKAIKEAKADIRRRL